MDMKCLICMEEEPEDVVFCKSCNKAIGCYDCNFQWMIERGQPSCPHCRGEKGFYFLIDGNKIDVDLGARNCGRCDICNKNPAEHPVYCKSCKKQVGCYECFFKRMHDMGRRHYDCPKCHEDYMTGFQFLLNGNMVNVRYFIKYNPRDG